MEWPRAERKAGKDTTNRQVACPAHASEKFIVYPPLSSPFSVRCLSLASRTNENITTRYRAFLGCGMSKMAKAGNLTHLHFRSISTRSLSSLSHAPTKSCLGKGENHLTNGLGCVLVTVLWHTNTTAHNYSLPLAGYPFFQQSLNGKLMMLEALPWRWCEVLWPATGTENWTVCSKSFRRLWSCHEPILTESFQSTLEMVFVQRNMRSV